MAAVKEAPQKVTRKRLRLAYNRGYNAGRKSPLNHVERGENGKIAQDKKVKKTEVVLNIGSVRIQINTED